MTSKDKIIEDFWIKKLGDAPFYSLELSSVNKLPVISFTGTYTIEIPDTVFDTVSNIIKEKSINEFKYFMAAFFILVHKYTNSPDVLVSTPVFKMEGVKEDAAHLLFLRISLESKMTVRELMKLLHKEINDAYMNHDFSSEHLTKKVLLKNPDKDNILYSTGLSYDKFSNPGSPTDKICLFYEITKNSGNYSLCIHYDKAVYTEPVIEKLAEHYCRIVNSIVTDLDVLHTDINILSGKERDELLNKFNDAKVVYPEEKTIIDLLEEQATATPNKTALIFENRTLTYKQLNESANQLAAYLRKNFSIVADDLVAIKLERTEWMVISILGILKSGAAYVPLDPEYPQKRIDYILTDSQCKLCLDDHILKMFNKEQKTLQQQNPERIITPNNLAYVIYTSGSTGLPKGVLVEHSSVVNRLTAEIDLLNIGGAINTCFVTNYVFDVSLLDLFLPLLTGGKIIVPGKAVMSAPDELYQLIIKNDVNLLQGTPTFIKQFLVGIPERGKNPDTSLTHICIGGESLLPAIVKELKEKLPTVIINNHYGPTETTIDVVVLKNVTEVNSDIIGYPIANTRVYIINANNGLVPVGAIGEICIGGSGLARGYLNRPELTEEKFVDDPFLKNGRLYKTGDLGRWQADGTIVFAGRKDDQVKLNGYRIELGDIENALQTYPLIDAAVAIIKTNSKEEKILVAYFLSKKEVDVKELRKYLIDLLPFYMLPEHYKQLETLPVTLSGKTDRRTLTLIADAEGSEKSEFVPASTATELQLVAIWSTVLNLGEKEISIKSNFFELGGHSLKATRLLSHIYKATGVKLELRDMFTHVTIESQSQLIDGSDEKQFVEITPVKKQESYELSPAQYRLWILSQFTEVTTAYNMPGIHVLEGEIDEKKLEQVFQTLTDRHEILRTVFRENDHGVRQIIKPQEEYFFKIEYSDLRKEKNKQDLIRLLIQKEVNRPFDLANGPLLRAFLMREDDRRFIFCYVIHHIICDGWSMGILIKELLVLYNACNKGDQNPLKPLRIQYKDFSGWQNQQLKNSRSSKEYWLNQFAGELPLLNMATDFPRPMIKTYNGRSSGKIIDKELTGKIKAVLKKRESTLFMGLLTTVKILLHRYTNQLDLIVGSPVAGRDHANLEDQIGIYINMLAFRTIFEKKDTFSSVLNRIKQQTIESHKHQIYPFDQLVGELELRRDLSRNPLFDVAVVLQNGDVNDEEIEQESLGTVTIEEYKETVFESSKFDLTFSFREQEETLQFAVEYNTDLYLEETIHRLVDNFEQLLRSITAQPENPVSELEILSSYEKNILLSQFNPDPVIYPRYQTLINLFEARVAENGEYIAVVADGRKLTYKELNEQANQLALFMKDDLGIKPSDFVALKLAKDELFIMCILAVLKCRAAFVPIDISYPDERITYILEDTQCKLCIDEQTLKKFIAQQKKYLKENILLKGSKNDLAYLMYTSGSTGRPKGVMIENSALLNLCHWHINHFDIVREDHASVYASVGFDAFIWEIFPYLVSGAALYIIPEKIRLDVNLLSSYYEENKITVSFLPTQIAEQFMPLQNKSLRLLLLGGDKLNDFTETSYRVVNNYGPTENTVVTSSYDVKQKVLNIPIGSPVSNSSVYITDSTLQLAPLGAIGEICIGGAGLAKGYWNNDALTAEKFVENPFLEGGRLYRTGDLARWLPDGNLEFIGRNDEQVKIRGIRIELGEIEAALKNIREINQVIILVREDKYKDKNIVAYFTGAETIAATTIKQQLGKVLPAFMIPAYIEQVDEFRLTVNGKVDKLALPDLESIVIGVSAEYIAPKTETEKQLAEFWKDILSKERIGLNDDFFELGGHSLSAIKLISLIKKHYDCNIGLKEIFNFPTIREFASQMSADIERKNVIKLNKWVNERTNCFFIPPISGSSTIYKKLALKLEPFYNCYGLQYPGFEDNTIFTASIKEMAALFCEQIIRNGNNLPSATKIIGYSMGTVIAFEVTKELEKLGYDISLILIDGGVDHIVTDKKHIDEVLHHELQLWKKEFKMEKYTHMKEFLLNNLEILNKYKLSGKVKGHILAIEAWDRPGKMIMERWKDYTEGSFQVEYISSGHYDVLNEENLEKLSSQIISFN